MGNQGIEVAVGLAERVPFRSDVAIMERPKRGPNLLEELEGGIHPALGNGNRIPARFPRAHHRVHPKWIRPRTAERMPVRDGEPQVRRHAATIDHLVGVVMPKREWIIAD